jgi:hypothetical protein
MFAFMSLLVSSYTSASLRSTYSLLAHQRSLLRTVLQRSSLGLLSYNSLNKNYSWQQTALAVPSSSGSFSERSIAVDRPAAAGVSGGGGMMFDVEGVLIDGENAVPTAAGSAVNNGGSSMWSTMKLQQRSSAELIQMVQNLVSEKHSLQSALGDSEGGKMFMLALMNAS